MDMVYLWRFTVPGETLSVHVENHAGERRLFDATLRMSRAPITKSSLNRALLSYPLMTFQVISRIYWQALRLWWKKAPYHPHPGPAGAAGAR
jgi:DUF1365 family protein